MAAGFTPSKNHINAPCDKCEHRDCAELRKIIGHSCPFCKRAIGYASRFYNDSQYGICHADCLEDHYSPINIETQQTAG